MTKGVITANNGEAEYTVQLEYDTSYLQEIIDKLQKQLVDLTQPLLDAQNTYDAAVSNREAKYIELDNAIAVAGNDGAALAENEEVRALLKALALANQTVNANFAEWKLLKLNNAAIARQKTQYENTRDAAQPSPSAFYCADYTDDLIVGAEVIIMLVPGENAGAPLAIYPAYEGEDVEHSNPARGALWNRNDDGQLVPPLAMTPEACYYNLAVLPGWQRWLPRYRHATITAIDYNANTADIDLDDAYSSVTIEGVGGNYNVNRDNSHPMRLEDVPIVYMQCNAQAFVEGDRVVVEFTTVVEPPPRRPLNKLVEYNPDELISLNDPESLETASFEENWDDPKIIGFIEQPKKCPGLLFCESGMVDPRPYQFEDVVYPDAAFMYWSTPVQEFAIKPRTWLEQLKVTDSAFEFTTRSYTAGFDSLSFAIGGAPVSKATANVFPSRYSAATGKMKLFLGAQLSSYIPDEPQYSSRNLPGLWSLFNAIPRHTLTKGILTATSNLGNRFYYYVEITTNQIGARQILFNYHGRRLLEKFNDGSIQPSEIDQAEAMLFANATGLATETLTDSFTAITGEPFYYGWHFNWSGDNAIIATTERVENESGDTLYHTQRLYMANISYTLIEDPDTHTLTFSVAAIVSKEEQKNCTPRTNIDLLWYPDDLSGTKLTIKYWEQGAGEYAAGLLDVDDAPMYAFYARDELRVLRYRLEQHPADTDATEKNNVIAYLPEGRQCGPGPGSKHYEGHLSPYYEGGFYFSEGYNQDHSGVYDPSMEAVDHILWHVTTNTAIAALAKNAVTTVEARSCNAPFDSSPYTEGGGGTNWQDVPQSYGWHYQQLFDGTRQDLLESCVVIPHLHGDAVYIGSHRYVRDAGDFDYRRRELGTQAGNLIMAIYPDLTGVSGGNFGSAVFENLTGHGKPNENRHTIEFVMCSGDLEEQTVNYSATQANDGFSAFAEVMGVWDALFNPILYGAEAYPFFDIFWAVNIGVQGNGYYTGDVNQSNPAYIPIRNDPRLPDVDVIGYNGYFIGWA